MNSLLPLGPHVLSDQEKSRIRRLERIVTVCVRVTWVLLLLGGALVLAHGIPADSTSGWSALDDYLALLSRSMPAPYGAFVDALVPISMQFEIASWMGWAAVAAMVINGWLGVQIKDIKDPPGRHMICSAAQNRGTGGWAVDCQSEEDLSV